ncbi:RHS repeat-associated core domain-containing protein [Stenotrophomonas sp. PUT21]|uniref:RHS repeat-associated core domain-containing protein n=1 Tax=Stenotrophomonas TaxID=40323 RepID=UPI003B7AEC97
MAAVSDLICGGGHDPQTRYDVQGALSIKNGQGYQFDFGNRLRVATSLERYRYDGHGRRSSVIDAGSGKNRHYLYSQGGALAYLWDQGTGERTQYIQLAGSPVAETNEQAAVVLRTAYTPYGASIGAAQDGVGYTGHVMDGSTGLTYMQQRYMDPTVGMFLSVDPVTARDGKLSQFNRYRYAKNSPYAYIDPDGRVPVVTEMKDGSVKISFPTKFSGDGASPENINTFKEQVASMSGTYNVGGRETKVTVEVVDVTRDTPRAARNSVKLTIGPTSHATGRSFAELGGKRSEINVLDRFDKGVVPHEVSHLGGVEDLYNSATGMPVPEMGRGIMNMVPGMVDDHTIDGIIGANSSIKRQER